MQWIRGLAFAAVHLAVAIPIVVSLEIDDATWWHDKYAPPSERPKIAEAPATKSASDITLDIDMCHLIDETPPRERIVITANPPAMLFTAWRMLCPPPWTVSGMLIGTTWERPTPAKFAKQRTVDGILLLFIAIQWLLVGGFPLRPRESLRRDPAALITLCTATAGFLSFVPQIDALSGVPILVAGLAWLFWLALFTWKIIRSCAAWISNVRNRKAGIQA